MTNNSQALRSETVARSIWDGFYKDHVDTAKKEYLVALALLHTIRSPFVAEAFYSGTPASKSQLVEAHADFLDKAMTLVSVLFSAINSPLRIFASLSKKEMLYDMRNAISFIESKCNSGTVQPSPAEKEVPEVVPWNNLCTPSLLKCQTSLANDCDPLLERASAMLAVFAVVAFPALVA